MYTLLLGVDICYLPPYELEVVQLLPFGIKFTVRMPSGIYLLQLGTSRIKIILCKTLGAPFPIKRNVKAGIPMYDTSTPLTQTVFHIF